MKKIVQKNANNDIIEKKAIENVENVSIMLKIPKLLVPVMKSICRITDMELDDLCTLLNIDQLDDFKNDYGIILQYMREFDTFHENLSEGVKQFYQYIK